MRRRYPTRPFLGVGGVVIRGDSVLLIRRGHAPQKGEWAIPGGLVELGETVADALRREVMEETGISVKPVEMVAVFEPIIKRKGRVQYHYVVLDYACQPSSGRLAPNSDVSDARWVHRTELGKYRLRPPTLRAIRQGFAVIGKLK
jgi:8-oxo-dGTP diphosphatase